MNIYQINQFKNRKIDYSQPVYVYKNSHFKHIKIYSIMQYGLVVAHTGFLDLTNCQCVVNIKGAIKTRITNKKNVHAFIKGIISKKGVVGTTATQSCLSANIKYNPYLYNYFYCDNLINGKFEVTGAAAMIFNQKGVTGAYLI